MSFGAISLFKDIFEVTPRSEKAKKGRSLTLIEKRNELLICRYYWHGRKKLEGNKTPSYSSVLNTVSDEFFLSTVTIPEIIDANYDLLSSLKKEWHDKTEASLQRHFAKKWPHLVW